jgi:basic membrane protein A
MHRFVRISLVIALVCALWMMQISTRAQPTLRVTHVVNGTLGDRSFFDSAQEGLERAAAEFGFSLKVIELGEDQARWEPGIDDAMADTDSYDILVLGGSLVVDYLMARADQYPDKKFIFHDEPIDFTKCKCANVYNVIYAQNEGAYLAGVYAAAMMKEKALPNLSGKNTIGVVGGLDIPVINDFIVGYAQGAKSVIPEMTVLTQYIGGERPFFDVAKGLEIALAMYDQGADFTFSVAGGSGLGMIQAAQRRGKYFIGVDSDQWLLTKDRDPEAAAVILTSMIKNVGGVLYRAIALALEDELPFGETEIVGIAEGAVGLAKNEYYERITPESVKAIIAQAEEDVMMCRVVVETTLAPRPCEPAE